MKSLAYRVHRISRESAVRRLEGTCRGIRRARAERRASNPGGAISAERITDDEAFALVWEIVSTARDVDAIALKLRVPD